MNDTPAAKQLCYDLLLVMLSINNHQRATELCMLLLAMETVSEAEKVTLRVVCDNLAHRMDWGTR